MSRIAWNPSRISYTNLSEASLYAISTAATGTPHCIWQKGTSDARTILYNVRRCGFGRDIQAHNHLLPGSQRNRIIFLRCMQWIVYPQDSGILCTPNSIGCASDRYGEILCDVQLLTRTKRTMFVCYHFVYESLKYGYKTLTDKL